YAKTGEVHLRVTARAATGEEAERMVAARVELVRERLGHHLYGEDEETLEQTVVKLMIAKRLTVATAESCTGRLLASRITSVPGSRQDVRYRSAQQSLVLLRKQIMRKDTVPCD